MYCDITNHVVAAMERKWMRKLAGVNLLLEEAKELKDYMKVLQDHTKWNTLSFSLRRYVYLHFTGCGEQESPRPYTVTLDGRVYKFSPVSPSEKVSEQELRDYADLLYRLTLKNGCYAKGADGGWDEKKGAIQKQQYLNYLSGSRPYRQNLFPMGLALGLDAATMERFMNVLGESPAWNFRCAGECIYYFCLGVPTFRNPAAVEKLENRYEQLRAAAQSQPASDAGMTAKLRDRLDGIVGAQTLSDDKKEAQFLCFLEENSREFIGYSKTARELLLEEIYTEGRLLDVRNPTSGGRPGALFVKRNGVPRQREESLDWMGNALFGEVIADSYGDEETLRLKELRLDRRLTANLPDGAHFRSALSDEVLRRGTACERVTKQDFLLQRLYKLGAAIEYGDYTERERLELVRLFHQSTDRVLACAGLPPIYVANPLDHLVLSALCTEAPLEFMKQVFYQAPRKRSRNRGKK